MEFGRFALAMVGHLLASLLYVLQRLRIINAVVDTTSILEHREELRELWEKRMMADDNQSSASSTVLENAHSKQQVEEEHEEEVPKSKSENETTKMSNGYAKPVDNNSQSEKDSNANHISEETVPKEANNEVSSSHSLEADHEDSKCVDSLEEDNNDDYVEEKTYTSKLENALITSQTSIDKEQAVEESSTSDEVVSSTTTTIDESDSKAMGNGPPVADPSETVEVTSSEDRVEKDVMVESSKEVEEVSTSSQAASISREDAMEVVSMITAEAEKIVNEEDDGFVRVEECLPQVDSTEDAEGVPVELQGQEGEQEVTSSNGHDETIQSRATPTDVEAKATHPEMEQFVKSGGVKRIIPGVQKTEQPYSTCTTETKIAMEIREMREREEELRQMREQALLSPVVSPVPPKSPVARTPSPCHKEVVSPTPSGPGYRVSSVFGHKGTTSPSPPVLADEERRPFKTESAVEREIRIARDREEELRKQKGLPPREDDSYVKPSQVKSSQVRVFGNLAGTNNNSMKQAATAKIQMEIEEQTRREMALRESGHIQTISQERTDAKVAKLKTPESPIQTNGNGHAVTNGNGYTNGRSSPDVVGPYKRPVSSSPTGPRPASIFSQSNGTHKSNISMHKFIASKGKEATFSAARNGGPFQPKDEGRAAVPPPLIKLKRNLSVESKIQQEIMEMKQREEELKKLHMNRNNVNSSDEGNGIEHEMNQNNVIEYENGIHDDDDDEMNPRHNKLIAQWEQRIQKAES